MSDSVKLERLGVGRPFGPAALWVEVWRGAGPADVTSTEAMQLQVIRDDVNVRIQGLMQNQDEDRWMQFDLTLTHDQALRLAARLEVAVEGAEIG